MTEKEEFIHLMERHPECRDEILQILARPSPPAEVPVKPDPKQ